MKHLLHLALLAATPAAAQEMDHSHHRMDHPPAAPSTPPVAAPAAPSDRAADRFHPPAEMAAARAALLREHGGMAMSQVMIKLAELRPGKGAAGYAWNTEAWFGGDIDRLVLKSEGEGAHRLDHAEAQALWGRAVDPYWNIQLGVRQDIRPRPGRTHATVAVEGLAPFWIKLEASLFLSNKGDVSARIEAWHDMRLTQQLILQPRLEANLSGSDDRATGVGSGLSSAELGLRLRYDLSRRFGPYVGIVHERRFGESGRLAALAGEKRRDTRVALGVRAWF